MTYLVPTDSLHVTTDGERILVDATIRDRELVKLIPGASWKSGDSWTLPLAWTACKALRAIFGDRLIISQELQDWSWQEWEERVAPALALRMEVKPPAVHADWWDRFRSKSGHTVRPFQAAGAEFMVIARCCILADDMGNGKTVQVILSWIWLMVWGINPFPALVVCPNSVKVTGWLEDILEWMPETFGITVAVVDGSAASRRKAIAQNADITIINWESVRSHSRLAPYGSVALTEKDRETKELNERDFRTVVSDEAHRLKDPKAKQTRAVWQVGHQKSVYWRYALTGTPQEESPADLWSILHFIDPVEWPTRVAWVERMCLQAWSPFGIKVVGIRPEMRDEFFATFDPRMRRMPKSLVQKDLPPKVRPPVRQCVMGTKQAKAYKSMDADMVTMTDEGELIVATDPVVARIRKLQFSSSYAEINEEGQVRLTEPSNKLDEFMELLEELGDTEPLGVFAVSRQLIQLASARLAKKGVDHRLLVGGMTSAMRAKAVHDFQNGDTRVILLTYGAGAEGLTLTRACHGAFLQRHDSMRMCLQAEDRFHRIGSEHHDSVTFHDFVTPGTVEVDQVKNFRAKVRRLQEILRDAETVDYHAQQELMRQAEAITSSSTFTPLESA